MIQYPLAISHYSVATWPRLCVVRVCSDTIRNERIEIVGKSQSHMYVFHGNYGLCAKALYTGLRFRLKIIIGSL
eukprot:COSAG05_NODE_294_length_11993_cov_75.643181_11_plen_74_part_00